MAAERDQKQIQADIVQARDQLASAVDQLADRLSPGKIAADAQAAAKEKVNSPAGKAVIGGVVLLIVIIAIRNLRKSKRS